MTGTVFQEIKDSLRDLYQADTRPWLVGFSGGKDSTLVASLIFDAVQSISAEQRKKEIAVVCTDTRVEIPAIVEMIETSLAKMRKCSAEQNLNIEVHLLRPPPEQSFWVNIIGRGYPPPNRTFRWCTQRMKIDPVSRFVEQRMGRWSEAILHLGARRAESATRAQTLAGRETRNGLTRHPDLPRVWVSNPIQFLTTEEVWAYLLQFPPAWGGSNRDLYKLYNAAGGGECPIQIDTSTPACGNSRFGCWTCTVVDRDNVPSAFVLLPVQNLSALKPNGLSYSNYLSHPGVVELVENQPLMLATGSAGSNANLTFFGKVGANYQLQGTSNIFNPNSWQPLLDFMQTNGVMTVDLPTTNRMFYYRLLQQ